MVLLITLTDTAIQKLSTMEWEEGNFPRIDCDVAGGCGISVSFKLIFDEPRKNDSVLEYNGIRILLDRFTRKNLDEVTQIDYSDEHGFTVGENFVSSACAIEIPS